MNNMEQKNSDQAFAAKSVTQVHDTYFLNAVLRTCEIILGISLLLLFLPAILGVQDLGSYALAFAYLVIVMPLMFLSAVVFFATFLIRFVIRERKGLDQQWKSVHGVVFILECVVVAFMFIVAFGL